MNAIKLIPIALLFILASCSSIRVNSDYDKSVDFNQYKTYAFHKQGIDKAQISEFDKKRILHAIDNELSKKGMSKSENPDLLINILTKERERIDVDQYNAGWGYGWGYGWNPYLWEGEGVGYLTENHDQKESQINEYVSKILAQFPPKSK